MNVFGNTLKTRLRRLQHSFYPIYYVSRSVGLWPFTILYKANGTIKEARICLPDRLWILLSISIYSVALYYTYEDMREMNHARVDSYFMDVINYITQIPILLFQVFNIILDMLNRKRLINILDKFINFDRKVGLSCCLSLMYSNGINGFSQ